MKNTRTQPLTQEEREKYREWGRQGGKKVAEKYGSEHMATIGKVGADHMLAGLAGAERKPREKRVNVPKAKPAPTVVIQSEDDNLNDYT